eukprot:gb/GECH01012680.1/.p1 GENE.gb/GECH01012680.1/~~gb/GECH01012680.1/.p1  ORF type:complete len:424 (+),score=49.73 gb/GECH01012680.1/:1-1272(+)
MKRSFVTLLLVCLSLFIFTQIPTANAKVGLVIWDGKWPKSGWLFVTKFCFDSTSPKSPGRLHWKAKGDLDGVSVAFYDDQDFSFPSLRDEISDLPCEAKINSTYAKTVKPLSDNPEYEEHIDEHYTRFWYIALSMCNKEKTQDFEMLLHFENPGSWWSREFSADKQGVLELYLTFLILYIIVGAVYGYGLFVLWRRSSLHLIVKLFAVTLYLYIIGVFLLWVHYTKYASDGFGVYGLEGLGIVFKTASELLLITLLLLMASGWTISTTELQFKRIFIGVIGTLVALYVILFIWAEIGVSPESTIYVYDTPPGITLAVLRFPLLGFFIYLCIRSYLKEMETMKKRFYIVFASAYSVWFLILPFIVFLAYAFDPWNRYIAIESISMVFYFISLVSMCVLLWPKLADKLFVIRPPTATGSEVYEDL